MNQARQLELTRAMFDRAIVSGPPKGDRMVPKLRRRPPTVPAEHGARTLAEVREDSAETGICLRCGRSHDAPNRQRLIRPMRDLPASEVAAAWPCFYSGYGKGTAIEAMLMRDLRAVRGVR